MVTISIIFRDPQSITTYANSTIGFLLELIVPLYLLYSLRQKAATDNIPKGKINRSFLRNDYFLGAALSVAVVVGAAIIYGLTTNVSKKCVGE